MKLSFKALPLFLLFATGAFASNTLLTTEVKFYTETITLSYDNDMIVSKKLACVTDKCLKEFYVAMRRAPHKKLLKQLKAEKKRLQLNEWLYAKLVRTTIEKVYHKEKKLHKSLAWWFLLCESDYDIRLTYVDDSDVLLYAPSTDNLLKVAFFDEDHKRFYNLTSAMYGVTTNQQNLFKPKYKANPRGKSFCFNLKELPNFKPATSDCFISFKYNDEEIKLDLKLDKTVLELFTDYPVMDEMSYVETPLSPTLSASLLPTLQKMVTGKSQKEAMEFLVAFTRTGFTYKWDWDAYDDDHPMYAEQVFSTGFSDHEDRCALLYFLVKELLGLPMLVITHHNDNMTLAVEIDEKMKRRLAYDGRSFTICDPIFPKANNEISHYPKGMEGSNITVVGVYK